MSLHLLHYMWYDVIASVGNGSAQVGNLQGSQVHLTLSDRDTDNSQTAPVASVSLIIIRSIGNHAALLARQVDTQLVSESHRHHVVLPSGHGILNRRIFLAVAEHIVKSPTEVSVAGCGNGRNQRQGRPVAMTTYSQSSVMESMRARVGGSRGDDTLLQEGQCLTGLEGRARRILSHDSSVEQRLVCVLTQQDMILTSLTTHHHLGVIGRTGDHTKHLTCGRLDGNDTAQLTLHQPFSQGL